MREKTGKGEKLGKTGENWGTTVGALWTGGKLKLKQKKLGWEKKKKRLGMKLKFFIFGGSFLGTVGSVAE